MIACLMIHGYTGGPYEIQPLADYLQAKTDWQLFIPTLPGHGEDLELEDSSYVDWLNAAESNLHQLKKKYSTIYLIGFSMGGMIASYLAAKYAVDKLVLLAPAGKFLSMKQLTLNVGEMIVDGVKGSLDENTHYARYREKLGKVPLKANIEFVKLIRHTRSYLGEVDTPVLIVHGQKDGLVPLRSVNYLDEKIGSEEKKIVLLENSDHHICLGEDQEILNEIVYDFLISS